MGSSYNESWTAMSFDLSQVPKGNYFVSINAEGITTVRRIVVIY
jgi:hypothetical protein